MEEIPKIIKKSDYNIVEQLGQNPSKISMLALLLCSKAHAKCAYHSNSPGHDTDDYWDLKNKIQDMIEAKEIEFDPSVETPNVINAPMPNHGKSSNAIDKNSYVYDINNLTIPLMTIKKNMLQAGVNPGFPENCRWCPSAPDGCAWLRRRIQCMMDNREVLFLKPSPVENLCQDMSKNLKIEDMSETVPEVWDTLGQPSGKFDYMVKYTVPENYKIPIEDVKATRWGDDFPKDYAGVNTIRISSADPVPRVAPLIITSPGLVPYSSDNAIP